MKKNLIDLHTHSVLSTHAFSSVTENIEYASSIGLKVYGISEHQPDNKGVGVHKYAIDNAFRVLPKEYNGMKILVGIELNILENGFDINGIKPEKLSFCIASMHKYAYDSNHTAQENTKAFINALDTPYVKILGHIDNPSFSCDYDEVVKHAKATDKIIELNNASLNPEGSRVGAKEIDKEILKYCIKYQTPIIMNSDAHIKYAIGNVDYAIQLLEEMNFPEKLILNYNEDLFKHYFKFR